MFETIERILLQEQKPSLQLNLISESEEFKNSEFEILNRMKETEQSKQHHPEGNVWIHTMMVVDEAAKIKEQSKDARVLLWSALLHDLGKPEATKLRKGKITAYDHDKIGERKVKELLEHVQEDPVFAGKVTAMVRWHMQILFVAKNMSRANLTAMKQEVDVGEVALLGMCDRLGRLGVNEEEVKRDVKAFRKKVGAI